MDTALCAIVEPRRRAILRLIADRELPAGTIASRFEISRPAISQHLRVLEKAGLVSVRTSGTRRLYRARPEGLEEVRTFFESLWDDSLARLRGAAEDEQRRRDAHAGDRD